MLFAPDWKRDTAHLNDNEPAPAREMFARWAADLSARGSYAEARERTRIGTEQFPRYATGWFLRARAELHEGRLARAAAAVERCLALESDFYAAWELLATIRDRQGRTAAARSARQRHAELVPGSAAAEPPVPAHVTAVSAHPEARRLVLKPVAGTPPSFETPTLAEVYRRQGLLDRALAVYSRILERHPEDPAARSMVQKLEAELAARQPPAEQL